MSKKNGREPQEYEEITVSGGVVIRVLPFPMSTYDRIQRDLLNQFPDIEAPKKIIPVLDGTEEVEDLSNPEYLKHQAEIKQAREDYQSKEFLQTLLSLCIEFDLEAYPAQVEKFKHYLIKMGQEVPSDPFDLQQEFLTQFAIRKRTHYKDVLWSSLAQSMIGDNEVANRLKSFRPEMEGAADSQPDASGPDETERLALEPKTQGT